jgi:hypothetical protein
MIVASAFCIVIFLARFSWLGAWTQCFGPVLCNPVEFSAGPGSSRSPEVQRIYGLAIGH